MDLREVGYDDRDWINLAQDRDRWRAYHQTRINKMEFEPSDPPELGIMIRNETRTVLVSGAGRKQVGCASSLLCDFYKMALELTWTSVQQHHTRTTLQPNQRALESVSSSSSSLQVLGQMACYDLTVEFSIQRSFGRPRDLFPFGR
ncbi:hypothetical protein ANN_10406 [Periplaneta americana]|uniref:Uncharacterized protein n=1 Tax=Periplaneta americana TaxID=6978 RepID=A0ABQ8TP08_PERAM|nr:hypothetical protein ANN_10406 [Periplaneta americana]